MRSLYEYVRKSLYILYLLQMTTPVPFQIFNIKGENYYKYFLHANNTCVIDTVVCFIQGVFFD